MQHRLGQNVPLIVRGSWEAEGEMVSHRKVRRIGCLLTSHISQCVYRQQQNLQPLLPNQSRVQDCFLPGRTNHPQKRWFGICFCGETAKKMKNLTLGLFLLPAYLSLMKDKRRDEVYSLIYIYEQQVRRNDWHNSLYVLLYRKMWAFDSIPKR